jgi:hypothetical protein
MERERRVALSVDRNGESRSWCVECGADNTAEKLNGR